MHDHNRYAELTNEQIADQLDTLVGNTTLLREASSRLRKTTDFETELDGMYEATEEFILDDTDYDGSEEQMLRAMSVLQGIANEYTAGGDQLVENCTCGQHVGS